MSLAQTNSQEAPQPSARELAQAIASLEARRAEAGTQAAQTVGLEEVLQHFGLDMTTDEVLAEVQAQRARKAPTRHSWFAIPLWLRALIVLGVLTPCAVVINSGALTQNSSSSSPNHPVVSADTLVRDTVGHATTMKTLAEIPDNHPVQCGITDTGTATTSGPLWTLVKHNGAVYLRCWTVPMSERALRQVSTNRGLTLFPTHGGTEGGIPATEPLTLALTNITLPTGSITDAASSLDAFHISLDSHAHETWNP